MADEEQKNDSSIEENIKSLRQLLQPSEAALSKEELLQASSRLKAVTPYNYDAWRLHADLLLNAIKQLEKRQLQQDIEFTLLAIPLREEDLRKAAEVALRQCAIFADSSEKRISLIDEANQVRVMTWF